MVSVEEFIAEKGSLDLLFRLSTKEQSFTDLKISIKMSPNTVLARLRDATKLGLVEEKLFKTAGRALIKYILTAEGRKTVTSLGSVKRDYEKLKKELDELKDSEKEKEAKITQLLSSSKATSTKISISGNKIIKSKNVKLSIENDGSSN
jgi:DNA-binding HxlR family transcriptional regulator